MAVEGREHWEKVYTAKADDEVSWYEPSPDWSLKLVREAIAQGGRSVIDVGGGTSRLVDALLDDELDRLAVLDVSETSLRRAQERLGPRSDKVEWIEADIRTATDLGHFDVWHDRALFHFLIADEDRWAYRALLDRALSPHGVAIIATFGPQGPERCSGLDVRRYDSLALGGELGSSFTLREEHLVDHLTPHEAHQQFLYTLFARSDA